MTFIPHTSRLAIFVLFALTVTAFFWLVFQGRGQAFTPRRPFVLKAVQTSISPPENAYWWWVGSDLTNGLVSSWVDRVHSNSLVNGDSTHQPTSTNNYVVFSATKWLGTTLTSPSPSAWSVFFILKHNFSTWTSDRLRLLQMQGQINSTLVNGICIQFQGLTTPCYVEVTGAPTDRYIPANNITNISGVYDLAMTYCPNTITIYTNAASLGSDTISGWAPPSTMFIGAQTNAGYPTGGKPFKGNIYEILIYTNCLNATSISNIHYYATNTYGYTP